MCLFIALELLRESDLLLDAPSPSYCDNWRQYKLSDHLVNNRVRPIIRMCTCKSASVFQKYIHRTLPTHGHKKAKHFTQNQRSSNSNPTKSNIPYKQSNGSKITIRRMLVFKIQLKYTEREKSNFGCTISNF